MKNKKDKNKPIDDETIACYVDGLLPENERNYVEKMMNENDELKELIQTQMFVEKEQSKNDLSFMPEYLIQNAKDLVSEKFGSKVLNLVIKFSDKVIETLQSTGEILSGAQLQPAYTLRGDSQEKAKSVVVRKIFDDVKVEVEISRELDDKNNVILKAIQNQTELPIDNIRATLFKDNVELESYVTKNGKAIFENIKPGHYVIELSYPDKDLGAISIQLIKK